VSETIDYDELFATFGGLEGMNQEVWDALAPLERGALMDTTKLHPQLHGLTGCRVEVVRNNGETDTFIVGRQWNHWRPMHLELRTICATNGKPATDKYRSVRFIENVLSPKFGSPRG
jgi:hypothetical protein